MGGLGSRLCKPPRSAGPEQLGLSCGHRCRPRLHVIRAQQSPTGSRWLRAGDTSPRTGLSPSLCLLSREWSVPGHRSRHIHDRGRQPCPQWCSSLPPPPAQRPGIRQRGGGEKPTSTLGIAGPLRRALSVFGKEGNVVSAPHPTFLPPCD